MSALLSRRVFCAGLLVAPQVRAQKRVKAIGVLFPFSSHEFEPGRDAFLRALHDLGYVQGTQFMLVERFADGRPERLPVLAAELVNAKVDLIYASTPQSVAAAQAATTKIPIVFESVTDPVQAGFADSLAHPGHNITGLSNVSSDLNPKRLQLLREMVPKLARLALLVNSTNRFTAIFVPSMRAAAESFGMRTETFSASNLQELETVFRSMIQWNAEAVAMSSDAALWSERKAIARLALASKLPSLCPFAGYVEAGALMSYGVERWYEYQKVAAYVRDIFQGAKAGDLPIEQPTQIELVISRKTADALGLTIPRLLLVQADKVME